MRFHMGVSFNLRYLKKFFIPFLIGIAVYFGINYLDIVHVHALTNMDTSYTLTLEPIDFQNKQLFNDLSYQQFFDNIISNYKQSEKTLIVVFDYDLNHNYSAYIFLSNTTGYFNTYIRGQNATNNKSFQGNYTSNNYGYYKFTYSNTSYLDSSLYTQLISCLNDYTNCQNNSSINDGVNSFTPGNNQLNFYIGLKLPFTFNNDESFDLGTFIDYGYLYYSNLNFVYTPDVNNTTSSRFFKTIILTANNNTYTIGSEDTVPTYYDLFHSVTPEPEPKPEPEEINVPFANKVYWFGEHDTVDEILTNIYVLIFIFAFGLSFMKILNLLRGVRK